MEHRRSLLATTSIYAARQALANLVCVAVVCVAWETMVEVLVQMLFLVQKAPRNAGYIIEINTLIHNNALYLLSLQWYQEVI